MATRTATDASEATFSRRSDLTSLPALYPALSKPIDVRITGVEVEEPDYRQEYLWGLRKDCLARVLERRHITGPTEH